MRTRTRTRTRAQTPNSVPVIFLLLPLLGFLAGVAAWAAVNMNDLQLPLPSRPAPGPAHTAPQPLDMTMDTVYAPPFWMAVRADGSASARVPTDQGMPPFPDCGALGIECDEWDVQIVEGQGKERVIDVALKAKGRVVGRVQLMRVQTAEFQELRLLAEQGVKEAWIGHVQVARAFQANGLGRVMWRAGDAALKIVAGSGSVRAVYDTVGWGERLMRHVPPEWFVIRDAPLWVYTIR